MIPRVGNGTVTARGIRNTAYEVDIIAKTYSLTNGGYCTSLELRIHRQLIAAGRLFPTAARVILRLANESMHTRLSAIIARERETGFLGNSSCVGNIVVCVYPAVLTRSLATFCLRISDGGKIELLIRSAIAHFVRDSGSAADRPRVERRKHVHNHTVRIRDGALADLRRHDQFELGGVGERAQQRMVGRRGDLTGLGNRILVVTRFPILPRDSGRADNIGGIRLQLHRGTVTDYVPVFLIFIEFVVLIIANMVIYSNIVNRHLRVVHQHNRHGRVRTA